MTQKPKKPVIAYTCGGSGGHIYPVIAIAQTLTDCDALFIGSKNRVDTQIIPKYGFPFHSIDSSNRNPFRIISGAIKAARLLRKHQVKVLVASGGYLTVSPILAAKCLGIPIVILEQNVIPGRVNRWAAKLAKECHIAFEESRPYFKTNTTILSGNPVRESIKNDTISINVCEALKKSSAHLVFGGSQGAEKINQLISQLYPKYLDSNTPLIHFCGAPFFKHIQTKYQSEKHMHFDCNGPLIIGYNKQKEATIFIAAYCEDMMPIYKRSKLVLCRAGATSIAEIVLNHKPALLIPYPYAKDDHQLANAKVFKKMGYGDYIEEKNLNENTLEAAIKNSLKLKLPKKMSENPRLAIAEAIKKFL